jgi:phosphoglycerate dehydrogenase-like enzyme
MTFLVTTPIPAPGMEIIAAAGPVEVLPAPPSSEDLARLCAPGYYAVVVAQLRDDLAAAILERAAISGVSVYAVGVNNLDLDAATRRRSSWPTLRTCSPMDRGRRDAADAGGGSARRGGRPIPAGGPFPGLGT